MNKLNIMKEILKKYNHEYLLEYYDRQDDINRDKFINQILEIDFEKQSKLFKSTLNKLNDKHSEIDSIKAFEIKDISKDKIIEYETIGEEQIRKGKLAIVTLAGGQGTRLGHLGPKGTFMLVPDKSLFEILCDILKIANKKYNTTVNWYIMTSRENNDETVEFFENNNYFDYPKENIIFFVQNDLPMNKFDGEIVVNEKGLIKKGSDGHGGIFDAMLKNNILEDIKKKNIEWVFVTPVDNPLIELVDSLFVGIAVKEKYDVMSKSIKKENPSQKSGVFCLKDNVINVLEYTEISPELMNKKDANGDLFLQYAHINCNMFNIKAIENILNIDIPYHIAKKKATCLTKDGKIIIPEEPNAYKYEKFIFDYFPYINNVGILNVDREKEYEPVKNSAEKPRRAYLNKKCKY